TPMATVVTVVFAVPLLICTCGCMKAVFAGSVVLVLLVYVTLFTMSYSSQKMVPPLGAQNMKNEYELPATMAFESAMDCLVVVVASRVTKLKELAPDAGSVVSCQRP